MQQTFEMKDFTFPWFFTLFELLGIVVCAPLQNQVQELYVSFKTGESATPVSPLVMGTTKCTNTDGTNPDRKAFLGLAFLYLATRGLTNTALTYVNFVTQGSFSTKG